MRGRGALVGVLLIVAMSGVPGAASAAPKPGTVWERPVASKAADAGIVKESFRRVYDPLPASVGPHPEACDFVSYLRFRHVRGPRQAKNADSVAVMMPGFLASAGYFDQVARNTIRDAAAKGRYVEFWALDRRSNCLEDNTGVEAAARTGDPSVAYGYYWGSREVDGKRFAGFKDGSQLDFLKEFGVERTVRDWYTVLTSGIPGQKLRAKKFICGGHSLGGPLTTAFADWDFDGNPATTEDAGYNQCAGFVGMDTRFSFSGPSRGVDPQSAALSAGGATGSPNVNTPPLTPETFQLPPIFAVGSYYGPNRFDSLKLLPSTPNIELANRVLFSRNAAGAAAGPNIREFNLTNDAVLGGVFDDNSAPLSFLRVSVGALAGGPLVDKNFPTPGDGSLFLPGDTKTPAYTWQNYNQVGTPGNPLAVNEEGAPYTSREGETSDIHQLARVMFDSPGNFIEQYFPNRITTDVQAAGNGDRSGSLANLRYDGPSKRPALIVAAGDSQNNAAPDTGPPVVGDPPNGRRFSRRITIPGYNHNDVLTASRTQNDGRPEPSSTELSRFMLNVAGPPTIKLAVGPRRLRTGRRVRVRIRVAKVVGCQRGVTVRFAGKRVRTNRRGRASIRVRLRRAGRPRVTARRKGCRAASVRVRVRKHR